MAVSRPRLHALIQRASGDPAFAASFLADPAGVGAEYDLTADQIEKVRELASQGLFTPEVEAHGATPAYY